MFILTSLWVVTLVDLVVQRARTHNRKPPYKLFKLTKTRQFDGSMRVFLSTFATSDVADEFR